jgi:hypothetical protein
VTNYRNPDEKGSFRLPRSATFGRKLVRNRNDFLNDIELVDAITRRVIFRPSRTDFAS